MSILRVFPERTSMTPDDNYVRIGEPDLLPLPEDITSIHVSCVFTWRMDRCRQLRKVWKDKTGLPVLLGGPAFGDPGDDFVPGVYLKRGVTITSRGCPNRCGWCFVPKREGALRALPIAEGYVVQDNNLLACPREHFESVCEMLGRQRRGARFVGGFEAACLEEWHLGALARLRIAEIWLACDTTAALNAVRYAVSRLTHLPSLRAVKEPRRKLRCYVLIGHGAETLADAEKRLEAVWNVGCLPFAQLYCNDKGRVQAGPEWRALARKWSRPAAMFATHKD